MDLVIGENMVFTLPLTDVDNAPLVVSTLSKLSVQVIQNDRVKAVYTLYPGPADSEIRVNPDANTSLDFELTKSLSASLKKGELYLKISMTMTDADFTVDGEWTDIDVIEICKMV